MKPHLFFLLFLSPFLFISQTWINQNSSVSNDLKSVSFIDDNTGWAVGRQGKIIRTTDGGTTWTEQNSGTTRDLNKVHMLDANTGFAVGNNGTFLKYNGATWSGVNINFSQAMHGVYFLDANTGWISGDWGRIMMTTNGGNTWTNQMTNAIYSNLFYDLQMISSTEGWAVGTSGRVLKYNGSNWVNESTPATADLYAVHFSSANHGFMTGKNSAVFQYDGSSWITHNTALPDNSFHVYDVWSGNNNLAYAATSPGFGGAGIILKYNGSVWVKDFEYTGIGGEMFTGVTATPGGNKFVVAYGGLVKAKLESGGGNETGLSPAIATALNIECFPNPFSDKIALTVHGINSNSLFFELCDLSGKRVLTGDEASWNSQTQHFEFDSEKLEKGIYFYTVSTGEVRLTGKLLKQ